VQNTCSSCHSAGGEAASSALVFVLDDVAGYQATNLQVVSDWLQDNAANPGVLLDRVAGGGGHPEVAEPGGTALASLIELAFLIAEDHDG